MMEEIYQMHLNNKSAHLTDTKLSAIRYLFFVLKLEIHLVKITHLTN